MKSQSIFDKISENDFYELVDRCSPYIEIDKKLAYKSIKDYINLINKKDHKLSEDNLIKKLFNHWYNSLNLDKSNPDYRVYSHPYYICDIWVCWKLFSRTSVKVLASDKSLITKSVVDHIGKINKVVDLGCGFGYTTAGLREIFGNNVDIIGVNLKNTFQYKVSEQIGRERNFRLLSEDDKIDNVDVLFASEYFEHILNPLEHAYKIITDYNSPKYIITANGFNSNAIGHFNEYKFKDKFYSSKDMNNMFNKFMRTMGYTPMKTKIWNNRPRVWEHSKARRTL